MSKSFEWMTGHDKAAGKGTPFPSPAELKADIAELETLLKKLEARQSNVEKARKTLQKPPVVLVGA